MQRSSCAKLHLSAAYTAENLFGILDVPGSVLSAAYTAPISRLNGGNHISEPNFKRAINDLRRSSIIPLQQNGDLLIRPGED
jgi:hypothetical protein